VAVLASGQAGGPLVDSHAAARDLTEQCERSAHRSPSRWRVDAEGATKFVRVVVTGARSDGDAVVAARAIASSQLVQCSLYGGDPYWGACSPRSARAARTATRSGSTSTTAGSRFAATESRAPTTRPRSRRSWPLPEISVHSELHLGHGEATRAHHRPLARVHRREHEDVVTTASSTQRDAQARLADAGAKAAILADALPYIASSPARFVVVKYGGHGWTIPRWRSCSPRTSC